MKFQAIYNFCMYCAFIVIVTISLTLNSYGQTKEEVIDSLQKELYKTKDNTKHILIYNELAWEMSNTNPQSALSYAQKALKLAQNIQFIDGKVEALNRLGLIYGNQAKYKLALEHYQKALRIELKQQNKFGIARSKNQIGVLYKNTDSLFKATKYLKAALHTFDSLGEESAKANVMLNLAACYDTMGEKKKAIKHYLDALAIFERLSMTSSEATVHLNLGVLFKDSKDFANAKKHLNKSLDIFFRPDVTDLLGMALAYYHLGAIHIESMKYDTALDYLTRSLKLQQDLSSEKVLAKTLLDIGRVLFYLNNQEEAQKYYQQSLKISKKTQDITNEALVYHHQGKLVEKNGDFLQAVELYNKSLQLAREIKQPLHVQRILFSLAAIYAQQEDYKSSYKYLQEYVQINDTLEKEYRDAMYLENSYQEERARRLKLEEQQERQEIQQKAKVERLTFLIYGLTIFTFLIVILLINLIRTYKIRHNAQIAEKNLQAKKKEVEDIILDQELKFMGAALEGQEKERSRIAKDLHDRLGNHLTLIRFSLESLNEEVSSLRKENLDQYETTLGMIDKARDEVRKVTYDMASGLLSHFGLIPALKDLKKSLEKAQAIEITLLDVGFENRRLEAALERNIFQIVQELITNVLRHAQATLVEIQIFWKKEAINLIVEDNGLGFDPEAITHKKGIGLQNIKARLSNVNGSLKIDSQIGQGTIVIIDIPSSLTQADTK